MFSNIGSKIKNLAVIFSICTMVLFIVIGIVLIVENSDIWYIGFLTMILGCLFSWLGAFFTYGFGELIENSAIIAGKQKLKNKKKTSIARIEDSLSISEEDEDIDSTVDDEIIDNTPKPDECPCCFHEIKKSDIECGYCGYKLKRKKKTIILM